MTVNDKIISTKPGLLNLAEEPGFVSNLELLLAANLFCRDSTLTCPRVWIQFLS